LTTVLIPKENEKDLTEIPDNVKKGLKIILINTVEEVLKNALTKPLTPIEWDEAAELAAQAKIKETNREGDVVRH
jgi:ATP-dependent Lon protease